MALRLFPRQTCRGLIEAGPARREVGSRATCFPGKLAGASLKRGRSARWTRKNEQRFPGKLAGASLKPSVIPGKWGITDEVSPANLPGPH